MNFDSAVIELDWKANAEALVHARSSRIEIGAGSLARGPESWRHAGLLAEGGLVLLVVDPAAASAAGDPLAERLEDAGLRVVRIEVSAGETQKTQPSVDRVLAAAIAAGADRTTPLIAVGGGCVGDLAAFAASVLLRGVPLILVPTTLLAMVDAAIGGKTAINLAFADGSIGRNLVGTFWPAHHIVADPATLSTLPAEEFRSGLAECVKHAWIASPEHLEWLEACAESLVGSRHPELISPLIEASARIKATLVAEDPLERGVRRHLNLGHTFAHAIEGRPRNRLRHGEAVAVGMVAAAATAEVLGRAEPGTAARMRTLFARLGLPTSLPEGGELAAHRAGMNLDKKRSHRGLRLVLPCRPGRVEVVESPPEPAVEAGWRAVGAE